MLTKHSFYLLDVFLGQQRETLKPKPPGNNCRNNSCKLLNIENAKHLQRRK